MKWQQGKVLIGCALYVDALKAPSILSKVLQAEKLDTVLGLQNILKCKKLLKSLTDANLLQWLTVKLVRHRIKNGNEYQGATLKRFDEEMLEFCKNQALADVRRLEEKMRERLEWSDVQLLRAILVFLDTQTWRPIIPATQESESQEPDSENSPEDKVLSEVLAAVEVIATNFKEPLHASSVNLLGLQDEWKRQSNTHDNTCQLTEKSTTKYGSISIFALMPADGQTSLSFVNCTSAFLFRMAA